MSTHAQTFQSQTLAFSPQPEFDLRPFALAGAAAVLLFALTGCGVSRLEPISLASGILHLHGSAHGGQQPVSASSIQLYAAGISGNASAATAMLTTPVLTDSTGGFDITADYTCPSSSTQVYITATGGNPGLAGSASNPALALVAALGDCGSLATIPSISINEVTTAAAAWALAPFSSGIANIGASATNTTGLRNAMLTAMTLADSTTGISPSASLPANASIESAKLYTLANILAACVNSDGTGICPQIFADATPASATTPSDTFQTALTIAANPGHNVATIFNDMPAHSAFGISLPQAPHDWTMSIAYTGGGLNQPNALAIDAAGNPWVASFNGAVSAFTAQGSPTWQNGITGSGLGSSVGIAIDPSSNIWVANMSGSSDPSGAVTEMTSSGAFLTGSSGNSSGAIDVPVAVTASPNGNMWVASSGTPSVTLLNSSGAALSGANGYGYGVFAQPSAIALDASSNAWIADTGTGSVIQMDSTGAIAQVSCCTSPDSLALDSTGAIWAADSSNNTLSLISSAGSVLNTLSIFNTPRSVSVDGLNNIWVVNSSANALAELTGSGNASGAANFLSPYGGFGLDAALHQPFGAAADASGNLWVTSSGDNRLVAFVGLAAPVATPKLGLPQQP